MTLLRLGALLAALVLVQLAGIVVLARLARGWKLHRRAGSFVT